MFKEGKHEELFTSLETIGAAFAIWERAIEQDGYVLISGNTLFEELTGSPTHECIGRTLRELFARYIEVPLYHMMRTSWETQSPQEMEQILERAGETRYWRILITPVLPYDPNVHRIITTCIEITEKKKLEEELNISRERFEAVVQTAYDGIISVDSNQKVQLINEAACIIFDVKREDVLGDSLTRLIPQRYRSKHAEYLHSFRNSKIDSRPMHERAAVQGLRSNGVEFPVEVAIAKIRVRAETEMTAVVRDISERVRLIEELSNAATQDPLTGIANRRHATHMFQKELYRCKRFKHEMGLVMMDIDHFKQFNDTYGHPLGDKVLKWVASLAASIVRETDVLCRWGGEEFLILLPETTLEDSLIWAERMRTLLEETPFDGQSSLRVTASFGVLTTDGMLNEDVNALFDHLDQALYRAKEKGRNCVSE